MNEFDIKALTWDDNPQSIERSQHIAGKIMEHVALNDSMYGFEYGCATGSLSFNLMPYLKHITLADSSDGMLDVLRSKIQKFNVTTMDVIKIDLTIDELPPDKFDIIYTAMTLHHIADVKAIIERFYKMLRPSGYLCIADLDKEDGSFHGETFKGHKGFDREDLKKHFLSAGFKNVKADSCYNLIHESEQHEMLEYPIFLMTAEK
jgi:ubiquinone/menaquinone biosynthesis C-methylase UbiE